ncbi:MAG: glutamate--tRNA ligase [Phycisphaerales bacterium]|nr:glutamate--tRNA ligase [Phycisphaerales bacterium]
MVVAPVYTRFAPSPTGHLHVGGARTALFCWALARRARGDGGDGRFIIRIEDTDQARSSDESARGILEDLAWLGIVWDEGPVWVGRLSEPTIPGTDVGSESRPTQIGGDPRGVGPFFQARRVPLYNKYVERLIASGRAYPAFETPREIEALRKEATGRKQTYRYDRSGVPMEERLRRMRAGEPHAVRFVAPEGGVTVRDLVLGDVRYAPGEMDDFVIRKADGFPTYHFAVVVDDETMGVTHVLRAQEHLNNTPRHVALQAALGFRTPEYAHVPLIFNQDGTKMSKRDKAKAARKSFREALGKPGALGTADFARDLGLTPDNLAAFLTGDNDSLEVAGAIARHLGLALPEIEVCDFRAAGYLPEAIVNFLALLGWNPGMKTPDGRDLEKFDAAFVAEHFSLERIGTGNAKFDRAKLLAFNSERIGAMTDAEFVARWRAWAADFEPDLAAKLTDRQLSLIAPAARPRCKTLRDLAAVLRFAVTPDDGFEYDPKAVDKVLRRGEPSGLVMLQAARDLVACTDPFEPASLNQAVERLAAEKGVGMGQVAQPLRVALTGQAVSPPLGETLAVLGRESALARIDRCVRAVSAPSTGAA